MKVTIDILGRVRSSATRHSAHIHTPILTHTYLHTYTHTTRIATIFECATAGVFYIKKFVATKYHKVTQSSKHSDKQADTKSCDSPNLGTKYVIHKTHLVI